MLRVLAFLNHKMTTGRRIEKEPRIAFTLYGFSSTGLPVSRAALSALAIYERIFTTPLTATA